MVADIDSYTPYIQAVFGNAPAERYIPLPFQTEKLAKVHPVLQAFITFIRITPHKAVLPQSKNLHYYLEVPALAAHFAILKMS